MHGVGEKLANKIWEIVESGELRKLDELSSTEEMKVRRVTQISVVFYIRLYPLIRMFSMHFLIKILFAYEMPLPC